MKLAACGYSDLVPLGSGGFSAVYAARHKTGDRVAVKLFKADCPADAIIREAQVLDRLKGKAGVIRKVEGPCVADEGRFISFEYCSGGTLLRGVDPRRARSAVRAVATALSHLHSLKGYHADICPENILLRSTHCDEVILADFGCARLPEHPAPQQPVGQIKAPETISHCMYSSSVDIFALGVTYAQLILNERLSTADSIRQRLSRIEDPDTARLIEQMIADDPAKRPSSSVVIGLLT